MSKGLKALDALKEYMYTKVPDTNSAFYIETIESALKALEIINKKNVDVVRIKITLNVDMYNKRRIKGCRELTQEEYDLLREVLL